MSRGNRWILFAVRALILAAWLSPPLPAHAVQRTFVSRTGNDANTASGCTFALPCRNFTAALTVTDVNGEIIAMDSAGYGTVTIDKAVSIIAPQGVYAGITAFSGNAITVNAPGATVVLRGLNLNGLGGTAGIQVTSVAELHVGHLEISGFSGRGVNFASAGKFFFNDSTAKKNGEAGVHVQTASGTALASIDRSRFESNGFNGAVIATNAQGTITNSVASGNSSVGFLIDAGGKASLSDCRVSNFANASSYGVFVRGNGTEATASRCEVFGAFHGFRAEGSGARMSVSDSTAQAGGPGFISAQSAVMNVERSTANRCGTAGMVAEQNGTLRVSNSVATDNVNFGFVQATGGIFESRGNNTVRGNGLQDLLQTITVITGS